MMVITLVAGVALAASESGYRGLGDQDAWAMDETTGSAPAVPAASPRWNSR